MRDNRIALQSHYHSRLEVVVSWALKPQIRELCVRSFHYSDSYITTLTRSSNQVGVKPAADLSDYMCDFSRMQLKSHVIAPCAAAFDAIFKNRTDQISLILSHAIARVCTLWQRCAVLSAMR